MPYSPHPYPFSSSSCSWNHMSPRCLPRGARSTPGEWPAPLLLTLLPPGSWKSRSGLMPLSLWHKHYCTCCLMPEIPLEEFFSFHNWKTGVLKCKQQVKILGHLLKYNLSVNTCKWLLSDSVPFWQGESQKKGIRWGTEEWGGGETGSCRQPSRQGRWPRRPTTFQSSARNSCCEREFPSRTSVRSPSSGHPATQTYDSHQLCFSWLSEAFFFLKKGWHHYEGNFFLQVSTEVLLRFQLGYHWKWPLKGRPSRVVFNFPFCPPEIDEWRNFLTGIKEVGFHFCVITNVIFHWKSFGKQNSRK